MGYYVIPTTVDRPLSLVVNPRGSDERARKVVWNAGDNRRKLITLAHKAPKSRKAGYLKAGGGVSQGAVWADGDGKTLTADGDASEGKLQQLLARLNQYRSCQLNGCVFGFDRCGPSFLDSILGADGSAARETRGRAHRAGKWWPPQKRW